MNTTNVKIFLNLIKWFIAKFLELFNTNIIFKHKTFNIADSDNAKNKIFLNVH